MQQDLSSLSTPAHDYISFDAIYPEMVNENGVAVWQASWRRRQEFCVDCANAIHPAYFRGLKALDLRPDRFPTLPEVNDVLATAGWRAAWVPGFIPSREFAGPHPGPLLSCFGRRARARVRRPRPAPTRSMISGVICRSSSMRHTANICYPSLARWWTPSKGSLEVQLYEARKELGRLRGMHAAAPAVLEAHRRLNELEIAERNSPAALDAVIASIPLVDRVRPSGPTWGLGDCGCRHLCPRPVKLYGVIRHPPRRTAFHARGDQS